MPSRPFDDERWQQISPHLDDLLELSEPERQACLETIERRDPRLASDLAALLSRLRAVGDEGFLEAGAPPSRPASTLAGQPIGAYVLRSPLGHGGMGSVWLAERRDGRFEGVAAVKLLNASLLGEAGERRFLQEGSILARLRHPGIARLIDAGVSPLGQPYLILEYVDGEPIDRYCDERRFGVEERVRLFLEVTEAVAHAHGHLIVHRDIKPSNVLVGRDGGVKLLDFGIAKLLEEEGGDPQTALTREGGGALTPGFAAPEQVTGGDVTTATDVYALGVLLYLLLSGRHPLGARRGSPAEWLAATLEVEPPRLSEAAGGRSLEHAPEAVASLRTTTPPRLRAQLRGDLDTIVAKALKKQPAERYASVLALADDLRRHLARQPVAARPDSISYRAARFVQRHRAAVAMAALVALTLCGGLAGTLGQARRAQAQAAAAEAERERADLAAQAAQAQRDFALRELSRAEAINDLNAFLLREAAPGSAPISTNALLARAEDVVGRQQDDPDETRVAMLVAVARLYELRSEHARARGILERAWNLAGSSPDPASRALAGCALASALGRSGEGARADELFRRVTSELPEARQFALSWVDCELRRSELGDPRRNVEEVEAAKRWLEASGIRSSVLELRVATRLADTYRLAGRHRDADVAFARAFARLAALGRDQTQAASDLLNDWALTLNALGDPRGAEEKYRRAIEIETGRGSVPHDGDHERVSPSLLNNLSRTLLALDRLPDAADYADRARRAALAVGDDTTYLQSLLQRAAVERAAGDAERAAATLAELEPEMRRRLHPTNLRFASLWMEQAEVAAARGDAAAALAGADRAVALAEEGMERQPVYLRRMLPRRSELRLRFGRTDDAAADAERALHLELAEAPADIVSSHVGTIWLAVARTRAAQGRAEEARSAAVSALQHLEPSLGSEHSAARQARLLAAGGP